MADLIDRKLLSGKLTELLADSDGYSPITDSVIASIKEYVDKIPSVDAEQVVHCKDCKYRCRNSPDEYPYCYFDVFNRVIYPDDFCSKGEIDNDGTD